jgi:hypothetical protein
MIFRYVQHQFVLDYLRCGWHIASADLGYHAQFAVLMRGSAIAAVWSRLSTARRMPRAALGSPLARFSRH